jgi:hypothetical protein
LAEPLAAAIIVSSNLNARPSPSFNFLLQRFVQRGIEKT